MKIVRGVWRRERELTQQDYDEHQSCGYCRVNETDYEVELQPHPSHPKLLPPRV